MSTNTVQNHEIVRYEVPTTPSTPSTRSTRRTSTSHNRKRPANHIPRPPNAFMLYRSKFGKEGPIPEDVQLTQQNVSRIAGICWRRLSPKEKAHWYMAAGKVEIEHAQRYPNYVYKPARRESVLRRRQKKSKEEELRHCEKLRKAYVPETIDQPPVDVQRPARKRKSRAKRKPESEVASSSLYSVSTDAFSGNAFMEPLIAPPNLNEQSLGAFHENTVSEQSPPEVDFSTLANEPRERFQRDKTAGAATTVRIRIVRNNSLLPQTAMFNAQYIDPSLFNSQSQFFTSTSQPTQSQFLPSSSQSGSSASFNCMSEPIFQDLLLPPASAPSFAYNQQTQANETFDGYIDSNSSMDLPLTIQPNSQLCDFNLVGSAFSFQTNPEITVNSDSFDIFLNDINLTTLSGNFAPEIPTPLFEDVPALAYDWNDRESFIDTNNNKF